MKEDPLPLPRSLPPALLPALRGGARLRWGVLAPGAIAARFTMALHAQTDQRVVAVASRDASRAVRFAAEHGIERSYGSYQQLAADPAVDVVYIASPHALHREHALLAIAAGKHVLIEKPIAATAEQARQIRDAAAAAGVFAMEAMHTRFSPRMTVIAQLLEDGILGDITQLLADIGFAMPYDPHSRLYRPELGGGALLDLGVYPLWFAHFVLGRPDALSAQGALTSTGVDAQSVVVMEHGGVPRAVVTSNLHAFTPSLASISGTAGMIQLDSRMPGVGPFTLSSPDGSERLGFTDDTGIGPLHMLCRQAVWAAQYIAEGRTESPWHPLSTSIEVLESIDEARRQLGAAGP